VAILWLAALIATPLSAQSRRADLSNLFLRNAPPPLMASMPVPQGSAFLTVNGQAFDLVSPAAITDARIDRFPLGSGHSVSLLLHRFDVMAPAGIAVIGTSSGDRPLALDRHLIFSGSVEGIEGSFVYLAIFRGFATGYVELPASGGATRRYLISPDNVAGLLPPTMIVYDERLLPAPDQGHIDCGTENLPGYQEQVDEIFRMVNERYRLRGKGDDRGKTAWNTIVAQVAVECDVRYFQGRNSNLSQAANYALIVFGASSAIYQRDMNVALQVPYLRIWTEIGPYVGPTKFDVLEQTLNYWTENMEAVKRSTVVLLSKDIGGGQAWTMLPCDPKNCAVVGLNNGINFPASGYIWDVDVTSHELGHCFGSPHTQSCSWAPQIDSCVAPEGECFGEIRPRVGTIMSYCHLTTSGIQLYFHPRVSTLIRNVFEVTSCFDQAEGTLENDIAVVQIVAPANGGSVAAGSAVTPSVIVRNIGTRAQTGIPVTLTAESPATPGTFYTATATIASLAPGAETTITFTPLAIPTPGRYLARASAELGSDQQRGNNTMVRPFQVTGTPSAPSVSLSTPNGGEAYPAGSSVEIRWSAPGAEEVTIQFSADDGITWMPIRYRQPAASGAIAWTVPAIPTTRARVRVNDLNDASAADISDATFTITVAKDLQALDFVTPVANGSADVPMTPRVAFRNNGSQMLRDVPVRLTMSWRPTGLEVYNGSATIAEIAPGAVKTVEFPITPLLPGGEHVMIARALLDGDEAPSNDSVARTASFAGLAPPAAIKAYPMSRSVLLSWNASIGKPVTGYAIYRGTAPENLALIATTRPTVLAYADEQLEDGTTYFYALRAVDEDRTSFASQTITAVPMTFRAGFALAPPEPLLPAADATDPGGVVNVVWGSVSGGEIYQMQAASDEAMTEVVLNQFVQGASTQIRNDYGKSYYWRVRAFNYSTTGPWSPVRHFTVSNSCAGGMLAFDGATTRMEAENLAWNGKQVTIEFWNYVASGDMTNGSTFSIGTRSGADQFQAQVPRADGMLVWDYGDTAAGGRIIANYTPYLNKWTHVALVSDGDHFKAIYLDGMAVNMDLDPVTSRSTQRTGLTIGAFAGNHRKGLIDEFRIWNRERFDEDIQRDMRRQITTPRPDLVGYWRFDEESGSTVADLSGLGADGTLTAAAMRRASDMTIDCANSSPLTFPELVAPAEEKSFDVVFAPTLAWTEVPSATLYQLQVAQGYAFWDAERDIPNVPGTSYTLTGLSPGVTYFWRVRARNSSEDGPWSPVRRFTTAGVCPASAVAFNGESSLVAIDSFAFDGRAATIEFWNYVDLSEVQKSSAFSVGMGDNSSSRMQARAPWNDGNIYWDYGDIATNGRLTASYAFSMNKWTHVALVANGIDSRQIYLDGNLAAASGAGGFPRDLSRLTIGGIPGDLFHKGMIDEFRVWNTPRTQAQIRADMYRRLPSPQSGLIGYWSMGEGTGTTTHDSSGFAHDGVLTGGAAWRNAALPLVAPPEPISGPAIAIRGSGGNVYSVTDIPGRSYVWEISGGSIVSGQGTGSITVAWGDGREGIVTVTTASDGGCAEMAEMHVEISEPAGVETGAAITDLAFTSAPNPFSASTTISYRLTRRQNVSLAVYSLDGALVARLADGVQEAGEHQAVFNGQGLPSGVYVCRIDAGSRYRYVKALHLVR